MELSFAAKRVLTPKKVDLSAVHSNMAMKNLRDLDHPERPHLLSVAENVLTWDHLSSFIEKFQKLHKYDNMYATSYDGREYFKKAVADTLTNFVFKTPISEDDVIVVAGSGAVMDIMSAALMDPPKDNYPGVGITPCYGSFNNNFSLRNNVTMYKANTTANKYIVTDEVLEDAYSRAVHDGHKVKMLVFTNPNNPTGTLYSEKEMKIVLNFCRKHEIHLFSDEIYALSVKPEGTYKSDENKFLSFAKLIENDPKKDDLWGFSKDIGLSGFRTSVLVTHNKNLHTVLKEFAHFCEVPADTQSFACNLLSDTKFMTDHITLLQKRVWEMRQLAESEFIRMHVPFVTGTAGFFSWINLREFLMEDTFDGEQELYNFIYKHGNIIMAPVDYMGQKYNSEEAGWFRWIFTCEDKKEMELALKGLEKALKERKH